MPIAVQCAVGLTRLALGRERRALRMTHSATMTLITQPAPIIRALGSSLGLPSTSTNVVQAAMQIADDEGLAAVTMNAVATKLGFTTMAVYRYFPNKEALLDAVVDAGMGSPPRPPKPRGDWRSGRARSGRC